MSTPCSSLKDSRRNFQLCFSQTKGSRLPQLVLVTKVSVGHAITKSAYAWFNKLVNEKFSTILHINGNHPVATFIAPMKTNGESDNSFLEGGVTPTEPAGCICVTHILWHTSCRHLWACSAVKAVPASRKGVVTFLWPTWLICYAAVFLCVE